MLEDVLHRSALDRIGGTPGAPRIDIPTHVTVIGRVGVKNQPHCPIVASHFGFHTAVAAAISGNTYFAVD